MLPRYFYSFIICVYLSGCNEPPYEPYVVNAYNQAKLSQPIQRFSSRDPVPELSNEWKKALRLMNGSGDEPSETGLQLENNIRQLSLADRDEFWRVFSSIPPAQQPLFLKELNHFKKDEQATLLDAILHLAHEDEKIVKVVLSGNFTSLSMLEQINLSNMVQNLKKSDQTLLFQFIAKLGYDL